MREIKFRAWLIKNKEMVSVDYFYRDYETWPWVVGGLYEVSEQAILMQYTGLKDVNGVEIYESDIVKVWQDWWDYSDWTEEELADCTGELNDDFTIHQIEYQGDSGYPAFDLVPYVDVECNGLAYFVSGEEDTRIEVIGNIHENPELLKEARDANPRV